MDQQEIITGAAFQVTLANGKVMRSIASTHFDCIELMSIANGDETAYAMRNPMDDIYGFVTSNNRFVVRNEAYEIAKAANQIKHDCAMDHNLKSYNLIYLQAPPKAHIITVS